MLLVHPGGPLWARRDVGAWSIPKGEYEPGEDPEAAARREFEEELGTAAPGGERPISARFARSRESSCARGRSRATSTPRTSPATPSTLEWPPRSGRTIEIPEVDRAEWFPLALRARRSTRPRRSCSTGSGGGARVSPSETISPTAHYTGYVWARNGLSHPELATTEGRILFESLRPMMLVSAAVGGSSLEPYLLARHRAIDALLERAIEEHGVTQVVEVASGLSPRGWRFTTRYGDRLTYVEADLPEMAAAQTRRARADRIARASATGSRPSTRCGTMVRAASPSWRGSSIRRRGWRSSPRGCSAISTATSVDGVWRRFAPHAPRVRERALHLRPAPRRRADAADPSVPRAPVGVRTRPGPPSLLERRRGRGGAAGGRLRLCGGSAGHRLSFPTHEDAGSGILEAQYT